MAITTTTLVRQEGSITSEYTDGEILIEIDITSAEIYDKYFLPKRSTFKVDADYTQFYFSDKAVQEIARVQVKVDTSIDASGWLIIATAADTWQFVEDDKFLTLHIDFLTLYNSDSLRVQYVPKTHGLLATTMAALNLVDPTHVVNGENVTTPATARLIKKVNRFKKLLAPRTIYRSSAQTIYDPYEYVDIDQTNYR